MTVALLVILFFVVVVGLGVAKAQTDLKTAATTRERISSSYAVDEIYVSSVDGSIIALAFDRQKLLLGNKRAEREYDFAQIAAVEVVENGATVTQTNRGSQLLGAAAGGLVFGGVGAVIGGLSGSTRSRSRLVELLLKITVDDRIEPIHIIRFLRAPSKKGIDPNGLIATPARAAVERVHAHLINAMRQAQREQHGSMQVASGVADLHKLFEMRQAGALTEEEFSEQKARLLAGKATSTPELTNQSSTFAVVLGSAGRQLIAVIKEVRLLRPELGLAEARDLVQGAPAALLRGVTAETAERVRQRLVAVGASVQVREEGTAVSS